MTWAVAAALGSASAFAVGAVMEHRAASSAPVAGGAAGPLRLLTHLVRDPRWLLAVTIGAAGLGLHALALRLGTVVVVQPVLACGLVVSLVLGSLVDRRHPGRPLPERRQWVAAAVVVAGLATFLVAADPSPDGAGGAQPLLAVLVAAALALGAATAVYARLPGARRAATALGAAAGTAFGVNALVLATLVEAPVASWPASWQTLALVLLGVTGVGLSQLAYQAGPLVRSLPALTVLEPLVALGAAGPVFGERLAPGWGPHAAQGAGAAMLLVGLAVLALGRAAPAPGPALPDPAPPATVPSGKFPSGTAVPGAGVREPSAG